MLNGTILSREDEAILSDVIPIRTSSASLNAVSIRAL
jgi:hypothetical protein